MLACTLSGFAQNLLINGSFEVPTVPNLPPYFLVFTVPDTTSIPGWGHLLRSRRTLAGEKTIPEEWFQDFQENNPRLKKWNRDKPCR